MTLQKLKDDYIVTDLIALRLTLKITKNVIFRDPAKPSAEPDTTYGDHHSLDMGIDGVWATRRQFCSYAVVG